MIWQRIKRWFYWMLLGGVAVGAVLEAPLVPTDMKWYRSYEDIAFDTVDGDLATDEYAVNPRGGWYVRELPKESGHFEVTEKESEIVGKNEVVIKCERCAYYSEFLQKDGSVVRVPYNGGGTEYKKLGTVMNYPQPKRVEWVTALESVNIAEATIAFDLATNSELVGSSLSFSHTVTGTNPGLFVSYTIVASRSCTTESIASITYNSVSMAEARCTTNSSVPALTSTWYLAAPSTGANTVVVTGDVSEISDNTVSALSYTGTNQEDVFGSSTSCIDTTADTTVTCSLLTTVLNSWVMMAESCNDGSAETTFTPIDPTQERVDRNMGNGTFDGTTFVGDVAGTSITTYTVSATAANNCTSVDIIVEILAAATAGVSGGRTPLEVQQNLEVQSGSLEVQ